MENKAHALIAGLFTLVMVIAAVLIALWLGRDRVQRIPYEMATKLSVPGLNQQAAVRYRGLDVGTVDKISFDPTVPGQILVHMNILPDTPITKSTYGMLGYQGVTGIAYVQLDDDGSNPGRLTSSKAHVARIEMRPSLLDQLQDRGLAILIQTDELAKKLNNLMAPENQKAMLSAFESVSRAATEIENIPRQLKPTLDRMPALAATTQQTMASVNKLAQDASTLSVNLNKMTTNLQAPDGAVDRMGKAADHISSVATQIEIEVQPLSKDIRSAVRSINRTVDSFAERPQGVLFGGNLARPGPGEAGFSAGSK
jgi:phospholipid/cholesterol/gamma-HCH transport system substrate-binding protein